MTEKVLDQDNWSNEGEWLYCKHSDCHYFIRKKGQQKRLLARIFPDKIQFKCDSCGQKSSYYFEKPLNLAKSDSKNEPEWKPLKFMIDEWEKNDKP